MDINTAVAWGQLLVWAFVILSYLVKTWRGHSAMSSWIFSRRLLLPLILVGLFLSAATLWAKYSARPLTQEEWAHFKKESVVGKTFSQERVLLDGRSFSDCTFDKVTLVYNGTAPFDFVDNHLVAPIIVTSDVPAISFTLKVFDRLKESTKLIGSPPTPK